MNNNNKTTSIMNNNRTASTTKNNPKTTNTMEFIKAFSKNPGMDIIARPTHIPVGLYIAIGIALAKGRYDDAKKIAKYIILLNSIET